MELTAETRSLQDVLDLLKPTTQLFRHLPVEPAEEVTPDIRFLGQVYFDQDGDAWAVSRLLRELDHALFFGNSVVDPNQYNGLISTRGVRAFDDREAFYAAVDDHAQPLRVFTPSKPTFISEGDMPRMSPFTIAMAHDAAYWKQLMPCTKIGLAPQREGLFVFEHADQPADLFKHEHSEARKRSVAVLYGTFVVERPENVLILDEGGVRR